MKLLLLGAGASKAYSQSPTGVRMPIARDFFPTFEKLDIYENPWVLRDGLIDFIIRVKGENPDTYLRSNIDIEELYSEIEANLHESYGKERIDRILAFKPYTQLTFIFSSVLNEIQNGPLSKPHVELAKKLNTEDLVVTFNWDTLMDRAMNAECDWSTDYGYGFIPKSIHRETWCAPKAEENQTTKILKLHGSTNWLSSHPMNAEAEYELMQEAAPDTVWVYESTSHPYACYAGRYMDGYQDFSYGYYPPNILDDPGRKAPEGQVIIRARPKFPWVPQGEAPDDGIVSIPLIIPPVRQKKYSAFGTLFDELWKNAAEGIRKAQHIIIIGYSFPKTDVRSDDLFLSAFAKRNDVPYVTVLDPEPDEILHKLRMHYGIPNDHIKVFRDYFTEETDIDQLFSL